jgi:hypothetical protein
MKPPLMIAGFCREKCGGFSFGADRPPVEVEPVERGRVFVFAYIMYRGQKAIRKR